MEEQKTDIESWRKIHKNLIESVIVAKEAVAAEKAQRRYWLEEICANLTPEGKLTAASIWKKPSKKAGGKRKPPKAAPKRKKADDTETEEEEPTKKKPKVVKPKKKKKVTLPPKKMHLKLKLAMQESDDEDEEEMEDATSFSSKNQQPSEYSVHEQEAAAALSSVGTDMSHIPEELRPFMAAQEFGGGSPAQELGDASAERRFDGFGGKEMRFQEEDDEN